MVRVRERGESKATERGCQSMSLLTKHQERVPRGTRWRYVTDPVRHELVAVLGLICVLAPCIHYRVRASHSYNSRLVTHYACVWPA